MKGRTLPTGLALRPTPVQTFERQVLGMIRVHTQIGEEQLLSARVVAYRTR